MHKRRERVGAVPSVIGSCGESAGATDFYHYRRANMKRAAALILIALALPVQAGPSTTIGDLVMFAQQFPDLAKMYYAGMRDGVGELVKEDDEGVSTCILNTDAERIIEVVESYYNEMNLHGKSRHVSEVVPYVMIHGCMD